MITCPSCSQANELLARRCAACGVSLVNLKFAATKDAQVNRALLRRWLGHGGTGVIIMFAVNGILGSGFSLGSLITAILIGFPLGFMISRSNVDQYMGAVYGCIAGVAYILAICLALGLPISIGTVISGCLIGLIPGALIGLHCWLDR